VEESSGNIHALSTAVCSLHAVAITALYLNYIPIPPLVLNLTQINLIIAGYFSFISFGGCITRNMAQIIFMIRLGAFVDNMAAAFALLCDPYNTSHDRVAHDCISG